VHNFLPAVALAHLVLLSAPTWADSIYTSPNPEGSVTLNGNVTGTGTGPSQHASAYNGPYKVTVSYNIPVITDSSGKKSFDLAHSSVVIAAPWDTDMNFKSLPIPITQITGDPNTGSVTGFRFQGTNWNPRLLVTVN